MGPSIRHSARPMTTLTLLVALALPVGAQSPKPQEIPVYGVGVGVVAVPVFVTDKNGKAAPGTHGRRLRDRGPGPQDGRSSRSRRWT